MALVGREGLGVREFTKAPWADAHILPAPKEWGGDLPGAAVPKDVFGFDPALSACATTKAPTATMTRPTMRIVLR